MKWFISNFLHQLLVLVGVFFFEGIFMNFLKKRQTIVNEIKNNLKIYSNSNLTAKEKDRLMYEYDAKKIKSDWEKILGKF